MKRTNNILSIILAMLMVISIIPITASAATYSGTCGDNATWTYDSSTYTLTISGTGDMYDYEYNNRPWENYEDKIKAVIIDDGITTIGAYAFYSFDSVESIAIPEGISAIGKYAFNGCKKLTSITIPNSVTIIEERTFTDCENLNNITLPTNLTKIGNRAFYCCENLENITIPKGVTTIGDNVFSCCYSLKEITIPDSVISIGKNAFSTCKNLANVKISASVTIIGQLAFSGCVNLTTIMVDNENQYYSTDESCSVLFNKDKTTLILYLMENPQANYNIPDTVTTICNEAFLGCENLTSLTIGKNVETIGNNAFDSCFGLTNLIIPDNVKIIGNYAFYNCFNLESVKIGNGVTSIGNNAFSFNDYFHPDEELKLKELKLGNSVTIIGEYAFCNCKFTSLTIPVSIKTIEWGAFSGCINIEDVYYSGSSEQWKAITIDKQNQPLLDATIHYNYHVHKYNSVVTEPTCTEQGYTTYTCECGDSYVDNYVNALGHNLIIDKAIAPDCVNTGLTEGSHCSRCDDVTTGQEIVPTLGHTYDFVVTAPTCTERGYTTYTCECGDSYVDDYVDATGHSHTSEVTTPATHTSTGVMTYTCTCGNSYTEIIDKLAEHNHNVVVTPPTCTERGYTTYTCQCGDSYVEDYVDATGHTFGAWTVTKEATVDTKGEMERVCPCGEKEYKSIDKLLPVEDSDIEQEDTNKEDVESPEIPNTNYESIAIAHLVFLLIIFAFVIERVTFIRKKRYEK